MLRHGWVGAGQKDAPLGPIGPRRPDLLSVDDVLVAVALGCGAKRCQVGAGVRLAEQLGPHLGAVQDARKPAPVLGLGASGQDRRAGPAHADRAVRDRHVGRRQLLGDDQLQVRVGTEPPRPRPVRSDQPGVGQLAGSGGGVIGKPGAKQTSLFDGVKLVRQLRQLVHRSPVSVSMPSRIRPWVSNVRGATIACWVATNASRNVRCSGHDV